MKKQGKKWMLVVLALLAVVTVTLPLVGCKNDTVAEQTGDGTGSGSGNQGTGDGTGSGDGNQGTGGETEVTVDNVSTVIEGLTGEEPHTLVVTGELKDLSAITTALSSNKSAKVNLDLSKVSGLKTIGIDAFSGCSGLTSISIPSSVEIIRDFAFDGCSGLTSINIPEGVTTIGAWAFEGCSDLTSISIPSSVTSIGEYAFAGCRGTTVKVEAENPPILGSGVFEDVSKILVPSGFVDTYKEKWSDYEGKIEAISDQTS